MPAKKDGFKSIVLIYNSIADPVFRGTLYRYILRAGAQKDYTFVLITFEQEDYKLSNQEVSDLRAEMEASGIIWKPLKWHSGRFILLKKVYDISLAFALAISLRSKGFKKIMSLGTISGAFAHVLAQTLRLKHYIYQYEPHGEFLVDFGIWNRSSMSYRLLSYFENVLGKKAQVIATGTNHMIDWLEKRGRTKSVYLLPSCVDDERMQFSMDSRNAVRTQFGYTEENQVFIYVGKLGGIYYGKELADFLAPQFKSNPNYRLLIVSPQDKEFIISQFEHNLDMLAKLQVTRSPFERVHEFLSAGDIGIVAVPPLKTQKFRSPIKVGEYLCCGIPYVVCQGVSEDDVVAKEKNVGVVVSEFSAIEGEQNMEAINSLLQMNTIEDKQRLRIAGIDYRGFSKLKHVSDQVIEEFMKL